MAEFHSFEFLVFMYHLDENRRKSRFWQKNEHAQALLMSYQLREAQR